MKKYKQYESAMIKASESETIQATERAILPVTETRAGAVVVRSWPGVHRGQRVNLHPVHEKRLLKAGFIELQ